MVILLLMMITWQQGRSNLQPLSLGWGGGLSRPSLALPCPRQGIPPGGAEQPGGDRRDEGHQRHGRAGLPPHLSGPLCAQPQKSPTVKLVL